MNQVVAKRAQGGQCLGQDAGARVPLLLDGGVQPGNVVVGGRGVPQCLLQWGDPLVDHAVVAGFELEGTAEVHCGDEVFRVAPGSFVLLPRGIPHWHRVSSDAPMRSLVLTTGQFEQYVAVSGEPAQAHELPPPAAPDMDRAAAAGERFRIEILGPPQPEQQITAEER